MIQTIQVRAINGVQMSRFLTDQSCTKVSIMNKISLKAWRGNTYLSLAELLLTLNDRISNLKWKMKINEIGPGPGALALESLLPNQLVSTLELIHLVSPSIQIIDGIIEGWDSNGLLFVRLRAVDSTWWDIETEDSQILRIITEKFEDALNMPQ